VTSSVALGAFLGFAIYATLELYDRLRQWYYKRPFDDLIDPELREIFR
jgi:hypothetical protein